MGEPGEHFRVWAELALQHYALQAPRLHYLRHSENITFQVTDAEGARYLLRLHRPITSTFLGLRQQPAAIAAEMCWLDALTEDTALTLPRPVRSRDGERVTVLHPPATEAIPCTLLGWVEGDPFPADAAAAAHYIPTFARLAATLHRHASAWRPPAGLLRPCYDGASFRQVSANLAPGVAAGVFAPADYAAIAETVDAAVSELEQVPRTRAAWGMIHNDLHRGNCLVYAGEVRPIDFSLCGWGYYLFDLGTVVASLPMALRRPFLDAYLAERPLPGGHVRLLEACFTLSMLGAYAFALPNPVEHDWLRRRTPQAVETILRPFLRRESFLFTL